jgi:hypothetical protein
MLGKVAGSFLATGSSDKKNDLISNVIFYIIFPNKGPSIITAGIVIINP